jgi:threonine synthase
VKTDRLLRNSAPGVLARYGRYLPLTEHTPMLSLGEGSTPLVRSRRLEQLVPGAELYFKLESCNPTGSFKDRGMVLAVAKALEDRAEAILCASTGNTSASAAAYAAHAGIDAIVLVPRGAIAPGKLAQAVIHGARILSIDGNFDQSLELARQLAAASSMTLVNSVNLFRIEGQKTAALEIIEELDDAPDILCIPVGNAGNITAYWRGFVEAYQREDTSRKPRMMGFQAAGAAPLVSGTPVEFPETVATAIRIGNPASWQGALAVTDEEILEAYGLLASREGIFGEPASAASFAGLLQLARAGTDFADKTIVCVVTGSGLKDPETALKTEMNLTEIPARLDAVKSAIGR